MKVLLLTNMPAYHQIELANQLNNLLGKGNFHLAVYAPLNDERKSMQWNDNYNNDYLLRFSELEQDRATTLNWIDTADVVVQGRFPVRFVKHRVKAGKLTFAYHERFWKKPKTLLRLLSRAAHLYRNYYSVNKPNYHLLAAGAYAADDLQRLGLFAGRSWKFGYFIDAIEPIVKPSRPLRLAWCGRMIELKQPQIALQVAQALRDAGVEFKLTMIGGGELYEELALLSEQSGLADQVVFTNWLSVSAVNAELARSHVLLMTSNFREGWGMVINEAINNSCLVVANQAVGSANWLVENGHTGLLYQQEQIDSMIDNLVSLCKDRDRLQVMAQQGHRKLVSEWSTVSAAKRLINLCEKLLAGEPALQLYDSGPCSVAGRLNNKNALSPPSGKLRVSG